jgi:DNA-binding PadR family transcriptional regulator
MLVNNLRPAKRGAIEASLERMVKAGMVQIEEYINKYNKKPVKRYRLKRSS